VRTLVKKLEPLHTVAETAKILSVSEKTVRRRIDDGLLRAIKLRRGDDRRGPCGLLRPISRTLSVTTAVTNRLILSKV